MKMRILILTGLVLLILSSSAFAATIYADKVESWTGTPVYDDGRSDTTNALGAPNAYATDGSDFLSIGMGGAAVLSFGQNFTGSVTIYEVTYNRPNNHKEYASVYASLDGVTWDLLGDIYNQDNGGATTLTFSGIYTYLKIIDTTAANGGTTGDGYDIDAVAVSPTPIPGAAWLLGTGLLGLIGLRGRFKG